VKNVEIRYRYDTSGAPPRRRPASAAAARDRLNQGSRATAALAPRELGVSPSGKGAPRQRPYAAVLGCSDARVPVELIFNEGPNDLFVVRVAGNGLGDEVLGSLNYAVDNLGGSLKLIVVLGHSGCGAVTAAVDVFLNPARYLSLAANHSLRNILDRLLVVIRAAAKSMSDTLGPDVVRRTGYREALIEAAVASNAALAAYTIQHEIGSSRARGLRAAYGVYLLQHRQVWAPRSGSRAHTGLAYPPANVAAFGAFADAVTRSERIAALLRS
jgi:carbonic anhydrase